MIKDDLAESAFRTFLPDNVNSVRNLVISAHICTYYIWHLKSFIISAEADWKGRIAGSSGPSHREHPYRLIKPRERFL